METVNIFSDLKDKIAIITGGYGYLGKSMVKSLTTYGCFVYVFGKSEDKFHDIFGKENTQICFIATDVSKPNSIEYSINTVGEKHQRIDILINNAYFGAMNHPEKMTSEEWRRGIDGGVNQFFDCIKFSIPFLKMSSNGKIINIGSMYGMVVPNLEIYDGREEFLNPPNYGASKAGVIHLTKYYAMYLAKYNINVNAVSPGPFPSKEVQKDEQFIKRLEKKTHTKRIGQPEDLNGVILLLSSISSNYITGQNIAVDGGWTL